MTMQLRMTRTGLTMIEILMAVALATFIVSIGFTGITALAKAISRAKQFNMQTQILASVLRFGINSGDGIVRTNGPRTSIVAWDIGAANKILVDGNHTVPNNWPIPSVDRVLSGANLLDRTVVFTLKFTVPKISNATGGNMNQALQTTGASRATGGENSMLFKASMIYQ